MGLGDWIMATGQVKALNLATDRQVVVVDRYGRRKWSSVFDHNPRIARGAEVAGAVKLLNAPGDRPYIESKTTERWTWKPWSNVVGELFLASDELALGRRYRDRVLIEPNVKDPNGNKWWAWDRWQAVADVLGEVLVQCGEATARRLRGVEFVPTTFRQALGLVHGCALFIGTEGALHHAAAALDKPAVVLWSEFISPQFTGYPIHVNLRRALRVCGARTPCDGCRRSMDAITVDDVLAAVGARALSWRATA